MKNFFFLFTAAMLFLNAASAQIVNIPDANFKNALVNTNCAYIGTNIFYSDIDTNNDGEVQVSEASAVWELNIYDLQITSLIGIQNFTNLTKLQVSFNNLGTLDVHTLSNLRTLNCQRCQLTDLNISGLANLQDLFCDNNLLTTINAQNLTALRYLWCGFNHLSTLNIQGCPNLQDLSCPSNFLTSLDLQGYANLATIDAEYNQLTTLNLTACTNLQILRCNSNQLTVLNVQSSANLNSLICRYNQLTTLFIKNGSNESTLDITQNPNLSYICCDSVQLTIVQNQAIFNGYTNCIVNSACTVATENLTNGIDLILSPNPTTDIVTLKTDATIEKIEVFDNMGRVLQSSNVQNQQINVTHLPKGIYFLKAYSKDGFAVRKFVKQ